MRKCVVEIARTAKGYLVRVEGHATLKQSPALSGFVAQALAECPQIAIAIDVRSCLYMDSTFLGCLLTSQRTVIKSGAQFAIIVDDDARQRLLAKTRLDSVLRLAPSAPDSISDFVTLTAQQPAEIEFGQHIVDSHLALAELPGTHSHLFRDIADQLTRELHARRPGCI
jgi:anti-anti-sigma factor